MIKKANTNKQIIPEEKIKCVNLTGIPDEELYGPDFLYEETEFFTEKKTMSTNSAGKKQEPSYTPESYDDEDDDDYDMYNMFDEVQCSYSGKGVLTDEEQHHINTMHEDGDGEIDKYEAPEQETPNNDDLRKLRYKWRYE